MKLAELVDLIAPKEVLGTIECEISSIAKDSREVQPGDLFFCIKGPVADGHKYLHKAIAAGAAAVVLEELPEIMPETNVTLIVVDDASEALRVMAGKFYDYPDRKLKIIALIGTNGKTTSTFLMKSILDQAGYKTGLIGTIMNMIGDEILPVDDRHNTTPGGLELQQLFARMVAAGITHVIMEVSSHAIHQGRVRGIDFAAGIFTNITQDHLDYHKTFEEYLRVKTSFFANLSSEALAVINVDAEHSDYIINHTHCRVVTYAIRKSADVMADEIDINSAGMNYLVKTATDKFALKLHLTGYFNVYNTLGVIAAALAWGIDSKVIMAALERVSGVPGRFERVIVADSDVDVIVDYAHTPDGLENVLETARELHPSRLTVVFGCGGDRDRTKRPIMGEIAAKLADRLIVTSDNPRTENPQLILDEVEVGVKPLAAAGKCEYKMVLDRAEAIKTAVQEANTHEMIVIAGKGHENYQIFADKTIHFDDREVAGKALEERIRG